MTDWKSSFKIDIQTKMNHAAIEYKKYKKENQLIYLQQASEKLYSAVENFLMVKYGKRTGSFNEIYYLVLNNDSDNSLLANAKKLHEFFYNGEIVMLRTDVEKIYNSVRDRLKARIR